MKKTIVTTSWDDGHILDIKLSNLLKQYGVKGTFYVSPKNREIKESNRLTQEQILKLSEDFEIGAHTMTHPRLTDIDNEAAKEEIVQSKKYLEEITKKEVKSFCFPAGYYNKNHKIIVKEAGFIVARTVERFKTHIGKDFFALPTTVHAYRHWSDAIAILKQVGFSKFLKCYLNWDELAIVLFNKTVVNGGVFHIWGHSWEIEKNNDWDRLERVFKYISNNSDVQYKNNGEIVEEFNQSQKTIAVVAPYFPPQGGGLERYAFEIASRLQKEYKWRVIVITSGERNGVDIKEEINGLTVYRLSYRLKISNTPFSFKWFGKIRNILKDENPDIVNIHTPVPGIGDIASMLTKKPIVATYHTGSMYKGRLFIDLLVWFYENFPMRRLLKKADRIICSSDFVRFNFLGKYLHKSITITPAVDSNLFKPDLTKKAKEPTILFVAGLGKAEQHKGPQILIDAVKEIQKNISDVRLTVVGEGDMKSEYERRVRALGLDRVITFTGRLIGEKLLEQYQRAHVFALPTSNDSFSMAILEAMASGLPVVASDVGSISSLISDNKTGFLIKPHDKGALIKGLSELLVKRERAVAFGNAGHDKVVKNFGWDIRAENYNIIFSQLLSGPLDDKVFRGLNILQTPIRCYPYIGGVERYVFDLSNQLAKKGNKVFVVCANEPKIEDSRGNITIKRLPYIGKISNTNITPTLLFELLRIPFDIIHTHIPAPWSADMSMIAAFLRRKPLILTYHNDIMHTGRAGVIAFLYNHTLLKLLLKRAAAIIIDQKEYVNNSKYLKPYKDKIVVIPIAVDIEDFKIQEIKRDSNTIFFLSSLDKYHRYKGLNILIKSIKLLRIKNKDVKLVIGGSGELLDEYKNLSSSLHLDSNIVFLGRVDEDDKNYYYQRSSAFVLPSNGYEEGFGIVALEAMANKTPIIVTARVGVAEDVRQYQTGYVVAENSPEELAEKIELLINNAALVEKLGNNGRNLVEHKYAWNKIADQILQIYSKILG